MANSRPFRNMYLSAWPLARIAASFFFICCTQFQFFDGTISTCQVSAIETTTTTSSSSANIEYKDEGFANLVAWMRKEGGRVDPRIDVQLDLDGIRGVLAIEDIAEEGTELLFCPWRLVLGTSHHKQQQQQQNEGKQHDMNDEEDMCHVIGTMADEFRLGSNSLWWPYLDHIELPRLAATWDESALAELQGLAPRDDATRHLQWFSQSCTQNSNQEQQLDHETLQALVSFITRASQVGMIPIYDLFNHHNGKRNAKLSLSEDGVYLHVVGQNLILRGEQLFLSYGVKSASTMYRDYGFVEEWPCTWNWKDAESGDNFAFVLFPDNVAAINPSKEFLRQIWHSSMPLVDFQRSANAHTNTLSTDELLRFEQAARKLRDGFATTLLEDLAILESKRQALLKLGGDEGDVKNDPTRDIISAIEYRIAFKQAVQSALACCQVTRKSFAAQSQEF